MQFFIFLKSLCYKLFVTPFIFVKNQLVKSAKKLNFLFSKKVFKAVFCVLIIAFLALTPQFVFNKDNYKVNLNKYLNLLDKPKIVLNLWHIETFEGGSASRGKYLEKQAMKFNNLYNNCYVYINTLNVNQLKDNLQNNLTADVFSFGVGAGCLLSSTLNTLPKTNKIRQDLQPYGQLNKQILAYPYLLSGYCLISHENLLKESNFKDKNYYNNLTINKKEIKGLSFAREESFNPVEVLKVNNIKLSGTNLLNSATSYASYLQFISKKTVSLLGTNRDVIRCKNREENGSLNSCKYTYLSGFSDLVQYIGVNKTLTGEKQKYAIEFAKFLLEDEAQKDVKNYGLFSTINLQLYDKDYMMHFENALKQNLLSVNVFSTFQQIESNKKDSLNCVIC